MKPNLFRRRWLSACLLLSLSACKSVPTQYYTLLSPPATGLVSSPAAAFQIEVLPVDIPAQVDVPQIVVRSDSGEMTRVETQRWIAPLAAEIRSALADDLSRRLGVRDIYGLSRGSVKTWRVALKVQRFDSVPGAYADIEVLWSVHAASDDKGGMTCGSRVRENVGPGYATLAQGHQRALDAVAAKIAAGVSALQGGAAAPACPG